MFNGVYSVALDLVAKMLAEAADLLSLFKKYEASCDKVKAMKARSTLTSARRHCRLCIVVNWAVDEIVSFKPAKPSDLTQHVDAIYEKLRTKGFGGKDLRNLDVH